MIMGYIEIISGGKIRVGLKQYVKLKDILKEGCIWYYQPDRHP